MALDPRITVMPDGSYFYAGSILKPRHMGVKDNLAKRIDIDMAKGACGVNTKSDTYVEHKASKFLETQAQKHPRSKVQCDIVQEHSTIFCNTADNCHGRIQLSRKTDITLKEVCLKYLIDGPCRIFEDSKHYRSRSASSGYSLLVSKYDSYIANGGSRYLFYSGFKDTEFVIVPICHGTANMSDNLHVAVHRNFDSDYPHQARYNSTAEMLADFEGEGISPAGCVDEWLPEICRYVVGVRTEKQFFVESERAKRYTGAGFFWKVNVFDQPVRIKAHSIYKQYLQ